MHAINISPTFHFKPSASLIIYMERKWFDQTKLNYIKECTMRSDNVHGNRVECKCT
jgi:hypothetical protein